MKTWSIILFLISMPFVYKTKAGTTSEGNYPFVEFLQEYLTLRFSDKDFNEYIYVSIKRQRMFLIRDGQVMKEFVVSTSAQGAGNNANSWQTPLGLHSVKTKIGEDVPLNGIFINHVFSGNIATIHNDKTASKSDDVTTRILWLTGEEPGINSGGNVDSYKRNIYIHGTPDEGLLGHPASHGCIRLSNRDVTDLFNIINVGTYVIILNN